MLLCLGRAIMLFLKNARIIGTSQPAAVCRVCTPPSAAPGRRAAVRGRGGGTQQVGATRSRSPIAAGTRTIDASHGGVRAPPAAEHRPAAPQHYCSTMRCQQGAAGGTRRATRAGEGTHRGARRCGGSLEGPCGRQSIDCDGRRWWAWGGTVCTAR